MNSMLSRLGVFNSDLPSCLVSSQDAVLQHTMLYEIIRLTGNRGAPLLIIDDAGLDYDLLRQAGYQVCDLLREGGCLYQPFEHLDTMSGISRFRQLLFSMGCDQRQCMKLISYLYFIQTLEEIRGRDSSLSAELLRQYSSSLRTQRIIQRLLDDGAITPKQMGELLARFSEVSDAAPEFEHILLLIAPLISGRTVRLGSRPDLALLISFRALAQDAAFQRLLLQLASFALQDCPEATVLILDRGQRDDQNGLISFLRLLPEHITVHLFSEDAFLCPRSLLPELLNRFQLKIYGRHAAMTSCDAVEKLAGDIDTVRNTCSVSYDRRLSANTPLDILFGRNKTESTTASVERRPRYRKEMIFCLPAGSAIAEYKGSTALFSCI